MATETMIRSLKRYVEEALDIQLSIKPWKTIETLPFFLQNLYEFYTLTLLGRSCILAANRESDEITPAAIRKHLELLHAKTGLPCIYTSSSISSYNLKRLIAHRVQFVIPNRQIYLPALGIDWIENYQFCQKKHLHIQKLAPSTQAMLIFALIHRGDEPFIPINLAKALNYTPMTMTRSLNELESFKLVKTQRMGKERQIYFAKDRCQLWKQAQPFMLSPVKKRFWLKGNRYVIEKIKHLGSIAGLSALAGHSMLSSPILPVYAISNQTWKAIERSGDVEKLPSTEEADIEIEVWCYDPTVFSKDGSIDLFSLFLSLKANNDERVEAALQRLMMSIQW
ncbi:MAG: hypothetical protein HW387_1185 [Parachlamydiales bacterium]|nr:hypothetical protein [Parachlamydiales bacterium]